MRGVVEVWRGDEKILEEPNMLVDGAGELLADIMTVSPSLSGIQDHATSSILDASNYRINAISFGTGEDAFRSNAHIILSDFFANVNNNRRALHLNGSLPVPVIKSVSGDIGAGFPAVIGLPVAPNPSMSTLEKNTSVSATIENADRQSFSISAVTPGNGQLTNFLPSAIYSATYAGTDFDDSTSAVVAAMMMGAFIDGSSAPYSNDGLITYRKDGADAATKLQCGGYFNEVSSMDMSGFVNMVMSSVPHGGVAGLQFSGGASGLCLSAQEEEPNEGFPFIEYTVTVASADAMTAHAYGGITHLGLWTIDMEQSLLNGNTPPFAFSILDNPRKYKLFCRKGVSKDLTHITDVEQYEDLTIKWRIHFR
jgi:hypothetical protein